MPRNKKKSINAPKSITSKIPYVGCFEKGGLIEINQGEFSVTYEIIPPVIDETTMKFDNSMVHSCMVGILTALKGYRFQFSIRNSFIPKEEFLMKVHLDENGSYAKLINKYNSVISGNLDIGHNNFDRSLYLTVMTAADSPELALKSFDELNSVLADGFDRLYGYQCIRMDLCKRLELLHDIYHPDYDSHFGDIVDFDGTGFSVSNMRKMRMNTKDVIAPNAYEVKERNHMKVGRKFARVLFINSFPSRVSDSVINDLTNVASNAIMSVCYEPFDSETGFNATARAVKSNTEVTLIPVRDTVEDRRNHRMERKENFVDENEEQYFNHCALTALRDSVAKEQPLVLTTFVICLFADSLDDLDRDTSLLKLSASKYACQIRTFDLQQHEAFVSVLPLANIKVKAARAFDIDRIADMLPLNAHALFDRKPTLQGLNAINDNLILIDRKNHILGLIAGMEFSGKTYQAKREAINTLMVSNDAVYVLTPRPNEWDSITSLVNGFYTKFLPQDFFVNDDNYALMDRASDFQKLFLEALIVTKNGFYRQRYTTDEKRHFYNKASNEAEKLKDFGSLAEAVDFARRNALEFEMFLGAIDGYIVSDEQYPQSDLNVVSYENASEMLIALDRLWNMAILARKQNRSISIIVDGIDELVYSSSGSDYLISLLDKMEKLQILSTFVIQDVAHIVADQDASIEFDYLLAKVNYFKLLSQGPVERKRFIERLNIPDTLVPYITDREMGEGVIISPSTNIPFNDRFVGDEDDFYKIFQ